MKQVYVTRDEAGAVCGLSKQARPDSDVLGVDDPEIVEYLRDLDVDLVRVLEDVIDLLAAEGILRFTDLPDHAQRKLLYRKTLRSQWRSVEDPLSPADELL